MIQDIIKNVIKLYTEATKVTKVQQRERKLRPSSFPYCGLRDCFQEISGGAKSNVGFGLDFYGSVGTSAHLVFQKYMGLTGKIVGDWECKNKKCQYFGKFRRFSVHGTCKCGEEMEYHELVVRNRHIEGHVDCLVLIDGKYYVLDYKTSTVAAIEEHRKKVKRGEPPKFPYLKNKHQIKSYCINLERTFGITISGWMLHYIARDNPRIFAIVGEDFTKDSRRSEKARMNRYNKHYALASDVIDTSNEESLKTLIEERPCRCYEDWKKKFGDWDECQLGKAGVCFTEKMVKKIMFNALENKELRPKSVNEG